MAVLRRLSVSLVTYVVTRPWVWVAVILMLAAQHAGLVPWMQNSLRDTCCWHHGYTVQSTPGPIVQSALDNFPGSIIATAVCAAAVWPEACTAAHPVAVRVVSKMQHLAALSTSPAHVQRRLQRLMRQTRHTTAAVQNSLQSAQLQLARLESSVLVPVYSSNFPPQLNHLLRTTQILFSQASAELQQAREDYTEFKAETQRVMRNFVVLLSDSPQLLHEVLSYRVAEAALAASPLERLVQHCTRAQEGMRELHATWRTQQLRVQRAEQRLMNVVRNLFELEARFKELEHELAWQLRRHQSEVVRVREQMQEAALQLHEYQAMAQSWWPPTAIWGLVGSAVARDHLLQHRRGHEELQDTIAHTSLVLDQAAVHGPGMAEAARDVTAVTEVIAQHGQHLEGVLAVVTASSEGATRLLDALPDLLEALNAAGDVAAPSGRGRNLRLAQALGAQGLGRQVKLASQRAASLVAELKRGIKAMDDGSPPLLTGWTLWPWQQASLAARPY